MNKYREIPIWTANKRIKSLEKFRTLLSRYYQEVGYDEYALEFSDTEETLVLRRDINMSLNENHLYVLAAQITTNIIYTAPPAIGGRSTNIDLLANAFNLGTYKIDPQVVIDRIDQALGNYKTQHFHSLVNTFNPFYWLWQITKYISSLPFYFLSSLGADTAKFEITSLGKAVKGVIQLIVAFAEVIGALSALKLLDPILHFLRLR